MSDSDDEPTLSVETFKALQEFYAEQEEKENRLNEIAAEKGNCDSAAFFDEDWQLSQFWYDEHTIEALSSEVVRAAGCEGKIALISCPSLFTSVKNKGPNCEDLTVALFEYDRRFTIYGSSFYPYDYKSPLDIPRHFSGYFDLVIADPPFLSEECLTKTAVTVKFLTKDKIIICTGAVMEDLIRRLLDVRKSKFLPRHKNNLANEFLCYSNYEIDSFLK
ncbi:hypothetical protein AAG570_006519 [Ranatra chinensis]|uniref:Protein-lysine N-methyltransferase AAG570_006519 n=1 Tax=Ranatra chinensis TaxID=642074 RepID=A0ABD0YUV1_9HEMI